MLKKCLIILVLVLTFPVFGNTQIIKSINFQLKSGAGIPLKASHFEKYWNPGIHLGAALEFSLNDMLAIKLDAGFNTFIFKHQSWKADLINEVVGEGVLNDDFVVNGGNRYILEGSVTGKLFPLKRENHINPFLLAGAGMVNMRTDELIIGLSGPEFEIEFVPFYSAGIGAEISYWDNFRFFGQVIYKQAFTKDKNNFNLALDFKETFKEQQTHVLGIEFGIIFDLVK